MSSPRPRWTLSFPCACLLLPFSVPSAWALIGNGHDSFFQEVEADLRSLRDEAAGLSQSVQVFQSDIVPWTLRITAEFADAPRNLQLLTSGQAAEWRSVGNPNDPAAFCKQEFLDILWHGFTDASGHVHRSIHYYLGKARFSGLLSLVPLKGTYWPVAVWKVPDPFDITRAQAEAKGFEQGLREREDYWAREKAVYNRYLQAFDQMLSVDPSLPLVTDEFGRQHPASLLVWRDRERGRSVEAEAAAKDSLARLDAEAEIINQEISADAPKLPLISTLAPGRLKGVLPIYAAQLSRLETQSRGLLRAELRPLLAAFIAADYYFIRWAQADADLAQIDQAIPILERARAGFLDSMKMFDEVASDIQADRIFVAAEEHSGEEIQAMFHRKKVLIQDTILPRLREAKALLGSETSPGTLLWLLQQRLLAVDPKGASGPYYAIFSNQVALRDLVDRF